MKKAITLKEAKEFDREAHHQRLKDKSLGLIVEWLNREIELIYPKLSYDEWYNDTCHPISGILDFYNELKEMYNKNGFDIEWQPPYKFFKIRLLLRISIGD